MEHYELTFKSLKIPSCSLQAFQQAGCLTVLPIFGSSQNGRFTCPQSGLRLSKVKTYGQMELENPSSKGVAIVPLHMGYIQDQAQNHALCRSAFIAAGQKVMFEDACCVQAAQGGYLVEKEQWFFILPLALRAEALNLRHKKDYSKLWAAISNFNHKLGLPAQGHLEHLVCGKRPYLTQYQSRLEYLPGQRGAIFFKGDRLAGIELAPTPEYFEEIWMPLVCFCYGSEDWYYQQQQKQDTAAPIPFPATTLAELEGQFSQNRLARQKQIGNNFAKIPADSFEKQEEERFLDMRLYTIKGQHFAGQTVEENEQLLYASIFATS